jgi:glycosyltransferase involved in cell wall biosynthesis
MSAERRKVVLAASSLGIGGTEKGLVAHALSLDRTRFDVRVVTWYESGPLQRNLQIAGIPVTCAAGDISRLTDALSGTEVVHAFRHGGHEPLLVEAATRAGAPVLIEGNMFGAVDRSSDESRFACHLFVSQMCLLRYRDEINDPPGFAERHRVSYLPIDGERLRAIAPDRLTAKVELGFDPERPVVGRIGRSADLKWRDLLIDMAPHLLRLVPGTQLLYVGMTPAKSRRVDRLRLREHVRTHPVVADERELAFLYSACDVVINASAIGESQGLANAEAMALGIPVVTCSTPWADNAQVELVDHGRTGWIASHPRPFAEAIADLLLDSERRESFGAAGRAKTARLMDPARQTRQLERLYLHHLTESPEPLEWFPDASELRQFERDYPERAASEYRALTARERFEARAERERDRLRRLSASARMILQSATAGRRSEGAHAPS